MKVWKLLIFSLLFQSVAWAGKQDVLEETLYYKYQEKILNHSAKAIQFAAITPFEQSLYIDALWDLVEEDEPRALELLSDVNVVNYDLAQKLRVAILQIQAKVKDGLSESLIDDLSNHLLLPEPDTNIVYLIASYQQLLINLGYDNLVGLASQFPEFHNVDATQVVRNSDEIARTAIDLFYHAPAASEYQGGKYSGGIKLYMFCRPNRNYTCLFAMRDANDEIVRNEDGTIWTQKSLAQSARKLPYNIRNGATPTGVWTIDSVMPAADQTISFGRFRRMIINFIPKSNNESRLKSLLPESSHDLNWWKPTIIARDMGRNLFRIHGTGKTNPDPQSTFYPFRQTSGCISQRENVHDGFDWQDQRKILDRIMVAQGNKPVYANETKIKGIFYFIEIDDKNASVEPEDLYNLGIE